MDLDIEILRKLAPRGKESILQGIVDYQHLMLDADIDPGIRRQMFLAQIAHESDGFKTTREYASGRAYEGRGDLGNNESGDGIRYRGRGLIQLTGRSNYLSFSKHLEEEGDDADPLYDPDILETFPYALSVSVYYWTTRKLNEIADTGDFKKITRRINGGLNGYEDRLRYLQIAEDLNL